MANPLNSLTLVGRLARDVHVIDRANGSKTVLGTIAVDDDFTSKNPQTGQSEVRTNFVPFESYIPSSVVAKSAAGIGGWGNTGKGDLVALDARIDAKPYTDKNGETQYPVTISTGPFPQYLEPRSVTSARRENKEEEAAPAAAAAPADQTSVDQLQAQLAALQAQQNQAGQAQYNDEPPF